MRRRISLFLVLILSMPTLYKAGFFTYFQLNRDFLFANYCVNRDQPITVCYAECFLSKGLQLTTETNNPDKIASTIKVEVPSFFQSPIIEINSPGEPLKRAIVPSLISSVTEGVSSPGLRPPIA
jgi:hypothetical protein